MAEKIKPRILIIGFGDTGVLTAAHLPKTYDITAVSTKPALVSGQELGARLTRLEAWKENYCLPFSRYKSLAGVNIMHGKAVKIDPESGAAHIMKTSGETAVISYDILVIASGTRNGFWRTDNIQSMADVEHQLSSRVDTLSEAQNIAVVGAGPTGVSAASHTKEIYPDKNVSLYFRRDQILPGYHRSTRKFLTHRLQSQGINLHPGHHIQMPKIRPLPVLKPGELSFTSGQAAETFDAILWAVGDITANSNFIPKAWLNENGFVKVDEYLRVPKTKNVFAVGDIAASDPNRSSARNAGFQIAAKNIDRLLKGKTERMKKFRAPQNRWGSITGLQHEGMRIFTPQGGNLKIGSWAVRNILFPVFVRRGIYRGIKKP